MDLLNIPVLPTSCDRVKFVRLQPESTIALCGLTGADDEKCLIENVDFMIKSTKFVGHCAGYVRKLTIMNCQFDSADALGRMVGGLKQLDWLHLRDPILYEHYAEGRGMVKPEQPPLPPYSIGHLFLDFLGTPELFNLGLGDQSWQLMHAFGKNTVNAVHLKLKINSSSHVKYVQQCLQATFDRFGDVFETLELSVEINLETSDTDQMLEVKKEKNAKPLAAIIQYMTDHLPGLMLRALKFCWLGGDEANICLEKFLTRQHRLESLEIYVLNYLDDEVKIISRALPNLQQLYVTFDTILDVQSFNEPVSQMAILKKLNLEATTEGFLELNIPQHLRDIQLSTFNVRSQSNCEVRLSTARLPNLTKLVIKYFDLRNDALQRIFEHMPNLRHLTLFRNKNLWPVNFCTRTNGSDPQTPSLARLTKLEYLELDSRYINEKVLCEIKAVGLTQFVLWFPVIKGIETVITNNGLRALAENCPQLRSIMDCRGNVLYISKNGIFVSVKPRSLSVGDSTV